MSYINLKSRPSVEVSSPPPSASGRPYPSNGGMNSSLVAVGYATPTVQSRTFSPPRDGAGVPTMVTGAATTTTTVTTTGPSSTNNTIAVTTTVPQQQQREQPQVQSTSYAAPSATANPAATLLKVELDHTKTALERQNDAVQRLERDKRQLADQLELLRRDARDGKDTAAAEWRKRLMASTEENEKLRSDMSVLHEDIAALKASLAESQRNERRAEGMANKLRNTEDALHRQEVVTNEVRKSKAAVENELADLRKNNPAVVLNSKIQQLQSDLEAHEVALRNKQTEILTLTRQVGEAATTVGATEERLRAEERHSAALVAETQELSRRLLDTEKRFLDREVELKRQVAHLEDANKLLQQLTEQATHDKDMAEQTLASVQREHKRQQQGTDLHMAQRGAEIESLGKQLDVYKNKVAEVTRELAEVELRAANDRKIRDGLEAEISRGNIVNEDLRLTLGRAQRDLQRTEKDHEGILQQLNTANTAVGTLSDEKLRLEKSIETANVKLEIAARAAQDLAACERALTEKRILVGELELRVKTLEPLVARAEALETMNEALRAELNAYRNEISALRLAVEEERDGHTRTQNKVRLLETKLRQSDDRHEEMYNKLKSLELVNAGDRSNQLAGTFAALHEKINTSDSDNSKILEVNAALLKEVKRYEDALREMEKQVARAREITREADMMKVHAEIARDEALQKADQRDREVLALQERYESYAPLAVDAERRGYAEAIQALEGHVRSGTEYISRLEERAGTDAKAADQLSAQRELNRQLQREIVATAAVGAGGDGLSSPLRAPRLPSSGAGPAAAIESSQHFATSAAIASSNSRTLSAATANGHHDRAESISTSMMSGANGLNTTHAATAGGAHAHDQTAANAKRLHEQQEALRTLMPSMSTTAGGTTVVNGSHKNVSPLRRAAEATVSDGIAASPISYDRRPATGTDTTTSSDSAVVASMAAEIEELRLRAEEDRRQRDRRIDLLSGQLADAVTAMRAKDHTGGGQQQRQTQFRGGEVDGHSAPVASSTSRPATSALRSKPSAPVSPRRGYETRPGDDSGRSEADSPCTSPFRESRLHYQQDESHTSASPPSRSGSSAVPKTRTSPTPMTTTTKRTTNVIINTHATAPLTSAPSAQQQQNKHSSDIIGNRPAFDSSTNVKSPRRVASTLTAATASSRAKTEATAAATTPRRSNTSGALPNHVVTTSRTTTPLKSSSGRSFPTSPTSAAVSSGRNTMTTTSGSKNPTTRSGGGGGVSSQQTRDDPAFGSRKNSVVNIYRNGNDDDGTYSSPLGQQQRFASGHINYANNLQPQKHSAAPPFASVRGVPQEQQQQQYHPVDPAQLDDDELLRELELAKKNMKRVLSHNRMEASPQHKTNTNNDNTTSDSRHGSSYYRGGGGGAW